MTATVTWGSGSGTKRTFELHPIGTEFNAVAGVYIFCKESKPRSWTAIYIGETDSFKRRLTDELESHHRWDCIKKNGATHICVLVVSGGVRARQTIETDLLAFIDTPCNRQ